MSLSVSSSQIVAALIGVYVSIFGLFKINKALTKKPEPPKAAPVVAVAAAGSTSKWGFEPPTLESFDEWEKNEENWKKWEEFMSNNALLEKFFATL